ncbi:MULTISPECIES: fumarylacetoacetate hydrolase family protein [unclassified Iodidimonas]|jgi:fumarylpyruvate hydrolase|uniref:fumarylacetoacetate hydrolase family protein n=1 Tax=unclassified Iodidimonas TaxID=2626145 RepID=UPI0024826EFA|nr:MULTISPECIES: fumarylacetoacetate hydrolase family protein [unclassified Iodidimonas]
MTKESDKRDRTHISTDKAEPQTHGVWSRRRLLAAGAVAPVIFTTTACAQSNPSCAESAIPEVAPPRVAIAGSSKYFPVRRVHCIGFNYREHNLEMGRGAESHELSIFNKPNDALVPDGGSVAYPLATAQFEHEIELVIAIGKRGVRIPRDEALDHVFGYAVGMELTRRDLQAAAKQVGNPWVTGKAFDQSAPISAIYPACDIGHPDSGRIYLTVNGDIRHDSDISNLIYGVPAIISRVSELFILEPGDLIYTGTPEGVGRLLPGDTVYGAIDGIGSLTITITDPV